MSNMVHREVSAAALGIRLAWSYTPSTHQHGTQTGTILELGQGKGEKGSGGGKKSISFWVMS
jgi:hypothetical protein